MELFPEFFNSVRYPERPMNTQNGAQNMQRRVLALFTVGLMLMVASIAIAQTPPAAYGMPIVLENARKAALAAIAEARKNNFTMAIAVVDTAGNLVYFEKMDGTQTGSVNVSIEKARSAVLFKRPTKSFQDTVAQGGVGLRMLGLPGAVPVDGGIPLMEGGKIVGAIGVSGGTSDQDGQCAQAGASVLK
jgi:glc operon protein GlcG